MLSIASALRAQFDERLQAKTLKAYRGWIQKFQTFTKSKSPELILTEDV